MLGCTWYDVSIAPSSTGSPLPASETSMVLLAELNPDGDNATTIVVSALAVSADSTENDAKVLEKCVAAVEQQVGFDKKPVNGDSIC
eukprot:2570944-Pleurochrysis_carterae.AAC.1